MRLVEGETIQRTVGGMDLSSSQKLFRFSVILRGRRTGSNPPRDTVYAPPEYSRKLALENDPNRAIDVPPYIQGPDVAVEIEVCDCADCEGVPGQGRCRRYPPIIVTVPAVTAQLPSEPTGANASSIGPGSSGESSRSRKP